MSTAANLSTEEQINLAFYRAVQVVLDASIEAETLDLKEGDALQFIEDYAHIEALEHLEDVIKHPRLRHTVARAFAAEAIRLVEADAEGGQA